MTFSHPGWLPAGFIACLGLLWMWRRYDARQHAALARFISAHLRAQLTQSVSIGRRRAQRGLQIIAVARGHAQAGNVGQDRIAHARDRGRQRRRHQCRG